jgi:hypothetical protein
VPRKHTAIVLDPGVLERYVGRYKFTADDILVVTRDGARLWGQSPGVDKYELVPEAEGELFLEITDAQVSFIVPPPRGARDRSDLAPERRGSARRAHRVGHARPGFACERSERK